MLSVGRNWNGHVYGTNTGNVAVTLSGDDDALTGIIRLNDSQTGLIVYDVTGNFASGNLTLSGEFQGEVPENLSVGKLIISGALTPEGRIDGEWSTTIGTGGTFQLFPHSYQAQATNPSAISEQLNTCNRSLGTIRLYADDVRSLIKHLLKDFSVKKAVVTFNDGGTEKSVYSDEFEKILDDLPQLGYLKLSVSEPELYGLSRNATIELTSWGENTVRVQSIQEAWAIGKAESLLRHVQSYQRKVATQFRKFGLSVNLIILVLALAALPGLPTFWQRVAFGGSAFAIQIVISYFHHKYVPNFILFPKTSRSTFIRRIGPGVVSWAITIIGGVVAAIIYGVLKGELDKSPLAEIVTTLLG